MTEQDYINSPLLGLVILNFITSNSTFKDIFKASASSIAADIESAATNPNCSCGNTVITYITENAQSVGSLLYNFASDNNTLSDIENLFKTIPGHSTSGRVAKTTIKDWPEFSKYVKYANFQFTHMSTSIVGDDVYVFFL
jgi:hypothetical protein